MTLWFDYGHISEVHEALEEGIKTVDIENWLQVCCPFVMYMYTCIYINMFMFALTQEQTVKLYVFLVTLILLGTLFNAKLINVVNEFVLSTCTYMYMYVIIIKEKHSIK